MNSFFFFFFFFFLLLLRSNVLGQSSGAVSKSRWPSWVPVPNKPTVSVHVKQRFANIVGHDSDLDADDLGTGLCFAWPLC